MTRQYNILVVEDEEEWREAVFREALEEQGCYVETSASYNEAIQALQASDFDLVVIDVNLTGVSGNRDGVRVLEWMTSMDKNPLAIVVSGSKTRAMAEASVKRFGPIAFVDKTWFDVKEFVDLVVRALSPKRS